MGIFDRKDRQGPNLYSLAPGRPFFDDLAEILLDDFQGRDIDLPRVRLFVPSRRAVRSVKESFAKKGRGRTVLLPQVMAVADLSEEDALSMAFEVAAPPLPEAPSPAIRRLKLASLYRRAAHDVPPSWPAALRAADELGRTADQLTEYEVSADDLEALKDHPDMADHAAHWNDIRDVLASVTHAWPRWLAAEGLMDPRARRRAILRSVTQRLTAEKNAGLVVAAGFLGTSPSTVEFLQATASMPHGAVVLPALDRDMTDEEWATIEAPHPQSAYRFLLDQTFGGINRADVVALDRGEADNLDARRRLVSLALMPTESTHRWFARFTEFQNTPGADSALGGLHVAIAQDQDEEADFIALELRSVLEHPKKTAFLVTADRILGRRVAAKLQGWGIDIDDSGGAPLAGSYRGTFLRLIARLMAEPSDAVALAGLIHHQLFGLGLDAGERRPMVAACDLFLRGRAPRRGWDGLFASLDDPWRPCQRNWPNEGRERTENLLAKLRECFDDRALSSRSAADLLDQHLAIAEALAETSSESGVERLYRFEDGEALEFYLQSVKERPDLFPDLSLEAYPDFFDALMQGGPAVRPPGGQHPRLSILGVLEARLQTADHVIVGGLQEGIWPGDEAVDPFLSRGLRRLLGLPSPDSDIGRVAHDFADFASSPQVLLTRSERSGQTPAKPSRFMVRLESFLNTLDPERCFDASPRLRAWRARRYAYDGRAELAERPAPKPPVHLRPTNLTISRVSTWLRDPYAVYAETILKVRPLKPYDDPFKVTDRGDFLHGLLESFVLWQMEDPTDHVAERLEALLPDCLDKFDVPYTVRILNARFIDRAISSFTLFEQEARTTYTPVAVERRGMTTRSVGDLEVTIEGRADRIDQSSDGLHIIDYKSGGTATLREDQTFSPQLFLSATIAEAGGFEGVPPEPCWRVSFVRLNDDKVSIFHPQAERQNRTASGAALQDALKAFDDRFETWLTEQFKEATPFLPQLHPFKTDTRGDFDDLSRRGEWSRGQADD